MYSTLCGLCLYSAPAQLQRLVVLISAAQRQRQAIFHCQVFGRLSQRLAEIGDVECRVITVILLGSDSRNLIIQRQVWVRGFGFSVTASLVLASLIRLSKAGG